MDWDEYFREFLAEEEFLEEFPGQNWKIQPEGLKRIYRELFSLGTPTKEG